jgi:hypothetical protein
MTWFFFVFFSMLVLDVVWAQYTAAVAANRAVLASFMSVGTVIGGAILTFSYIGHGLLMVVASCLGALCGTYLSLRYRQILGLVRWM